MTSSRCVGGCGGHFRVFYQHYLFVQDQAIEALRRSKFKFPGRQKIFVSKNWGFSKWTREQYPVMKEAGTLKNDGVNVKYIPEHGPLSAWCKTQAELAGVDC